MAVRHAPGRLAGVDGGGLGVAASDDANVCLQMAVGERNLVAPCEVSAREFGEAAGVGGVGDVCVRRTHLEFAVGAKDARIH